MRLFLQFAMIFFGTLLAAGLLALGEPQAGPAVATQDSTHRAVLLVLQGSWPDSTVAPSRR